MHAAVSQTAPMIAILNFSKRPLEYHPATVYKQMQ